MSGLGRPAVESGGGRPSDPVPVAILVSRFNGDITERLLEGAMRCMRELGGGTGRADVYHVDGAWELPQLAGRVARLGRHDAIVALGCVIRGETPHFHYVCDEANRGLGEVARASKAPLTFGVLTTENHAQALARAGDDQTNKGYEATQAALRLVSLYRSLDQG